MMDAITVCSLTLKTLFFTTAKAKQKPQDAKSVESL